MEGATIAPALIPAYGVSAQRSVDTRSMSMIDSGTVAPDGGDAAARKLIPTCGEEGQTNGAELQCLRLLFATSRRGTFMVRTAVRARDRHVLMSRPRPK